MLSNAFCRGEGSWLFAVRMEHQFCSMGRSKQFYLAVPVLVWQPADKAICETSGQVAEVIGIWEAQVLLRRTRWSNFCITTVFHAYHTGPCCLCSINCHVIDDFILTLIAGLGPTEPINLPPSVHSSFNVSPNLVTVYITMKTVTLMCFRRRQIVQMRRQ